MDSNAGKTSLEQDANGVAGITGSAVAFFTVLAIFVYPVGLLIFAAQLWTVYAYPLIISLNAAALAPTAETAFKVFHSIFWFFGALFCVLVVRSLMIGSSTFGESYGGKIGLLIFVLLRGCANREAAIQRLATVRMMKRPS